MVFLRVALWWLRQDTWPIDDALFDEKLSEYLKKLLLYYIDHGAKMSIRFPRAEEASRWSGRGAILHTSPTVEYHGGAANIVANYVSHFGNPQIFQVSIPLISFGKNGFLYFYLEETWHRYLALSMPMCIVSSDGTCRKRKENTGIRATACCDFYNYFSLGSESPNKETAGREFAKAAVENVKRVGRLAKMKAWHFGQGEYESDQTSFDPTAFPPSTIGGSEFTRAARCDYRRECILYLWSGKPRELSVSNVTPYHGRRNR